MSFSSSLFERIYQHAGKRFAEPQRSINFLHNAYEFFRTEKEIVFRLHDNGLPGFHVCMSYSLMVSILQKEMLENIFYGVDKTSAPVPFTVMAVGEFGRNESFPYATLDIICLYEDQSSFDLNRFKDVFLTRFVSRLQEWGIRINYIVDSFRGFFSRLSSSEEELHLLRTNLLSARYVAGSQSLFQKFQKAFEQYVVCNSQLLGCYWDWQEKQHTKYGESFALREPNIVKGIGGLRDCQQWLNFEQGVHQRDLFDRTNIVKCNLSSIHEFLLRLRNTLYFVSGSNCEVLHFEKLSSVARVFGYIEGPEVEGACQLLKDFYEKAAKVAQLHLLSKTKFAFRAKVTSKFASHYTSGKKFDGFCIKGGFLLPQHSNVFEECPVRLVRVFRYLQRFKVQLSPDLIRLLISKGESNLGPSIARNSEANEVFMEILSESGNVYPILIHMSNFKILEKILPEFNGAIKHLSTKIYQDYTTGLHTLKTLQFLDELFNAAKPRLRPYQDALSRLPEPRLIYFSLLLHDLGKLFKTKDFDKETLKIAQDILERFNLNLYQKEFVLFLIQHHRTMFEFCGEKDVYDPEVHKAFAEIARGTLGLNGLYIHSFCGLNSINKTIWNNHKDALHQALYVGTLACLLDERPNTDYLAKLEQQLKAFSKAPEWGIAVKEHLAQTPEAHLIQYPTEVLKNHIEYIQVLKESKQPYVRWLDEPNFGINTLTLVTYNTPGILAKICTILTYEKFSILTLKTSARKDNIYVISFGIVNAEGQSIESAKEKKQCLNLIQQAFAQKNPEKFDKQISKRLAANKTTLKFKTPPSLNIYNDAIENRVIIELRTADRLGILYQICKIFVNDQFDVIFAYVRTENECVFDTFHIRPFSGKANLINLRERLSPIVLGD